MTDNRVAYLEYWIEPTPKQLQATGEWTVAGQISRAIDGGIRIQRTNSGVLLSTKAQPGRDSAAARTRPRLCRAPHLRHVQWVVSSLPNRVSSAAPTLFFGSFIPRASRSDLTELRRPSPRPVRRMPGTLISRRNLVPRMF